MRNIKFENDEYYHIYNRSVEKRDLFDDKYDLLRFIQTINEFNNEKPIGSILENVHNKKVNSYEEKKPLVNFLAFCINTNHYHFILKQLSDNGIPKFLHKFSTGYTKYFNEKNKRSGSLFTGSYRAKHINSDKYLLHLSAYVNLNYKVHGLDKFGSLASKFITSSWEQYTDTGKENDNRLFIPCETDLVLGRFSNKKDYKNYAEETVKEIILTRAEEENDGLI